jgi:hypothetical protein
VQDEAADVSIGKRIDLPSDFVVGQIVVPEPERGQGEFTRRIKEFVRRFGIACAILTETAIYSSISTRQPRLPGLP